MTDDRVSPQRPPRRRDGEEEHDLIRSGLPGGK